MLQPEIGRCPECSEAPREIVHIDKQAMCWQCLIKAKQKSKPKNLTPTKPRYDGVYWAGLKWLNTL